MCLALGFWEIILIPWHVLPDGNVIVYLGTLDNLRWRLALPELGLATPKDQYCGLGWGLWVMPEGAVDCGHHWAVMPV